MMLVEEGRVGLDDPLSKYIPAFANPRVLVSAESMETCKAKREISIRDLLRHTSGLTHPDHKVTGDVYVNARIGVGLRPNPQVLAEIVQEYARLPLAFHPGEGWAYGISTDVLGRVVEVVSGMPLDRYFREQIFIPLGMNDTHFQVPPEKLDRVVAVYRKGANDRLVRVNDGEELLDPRLRVLYEPSYPYTGSHRYLSGGAGLSSTATDYIRFCQALLNGGTLDTRRILKSRTIETMSQNNLDEVSMQQFGYRYFEGETCGFGLGFLVVQDVEQDAHRPLVDSYMWGGFFSTFFRIVPRKDWAIVTLFQVVLKDEFLVWPLEIERMVNSAIMD